MLIAVCVVYGLLMGCVCVYMAYEHKRKKHMQKQLISLALKVNEISDFTAKVEQTTGRELYELRKEFNEFVADYGEAAVTALREEARQQKALADGLNSIMQFGADLYGRGEAK